MDHFLYHHRHKPLSRGGGYRGGRGSLPKALLDNKVPRETMGKIIAYILMISYIAPSDHEVFAHALQMLIQEFQPCFSANIIKQYLNGNRFDLGGWCAGPPGNVASNQGGERRGGWQKDQHEKVLSSYSLSKTKNPIYFIISAAQDAERNNYSGAATIVINPVRSKAEEIVAFKCISGLASYNAKRGNFSSDWLYVVCVLKDTELDVEVPLHTCLGKKGKNFTVFIPSWTTQCNTLRKLLLNHVALQGSGPMALMQHCPSPAEVCELTSTPKKCFEHLAGMAPMTQVLYKQMIRDEWIENTVQPKMNEKLSSYLRRHCHRDEAKNAAMRFANTTESSIGEKATKGKKKTAKGKERLVAKLEADKWNDNTTDKADSANNNTNNDITDGYRMLSEDAEEDEVIAVAQQASTNDKVDSNEVKSKQGVTHVDENAIGITQIKLEEVRLIRELGIGTTVTIVNDVVTCNCEMFTRWMMCRHCIWFDFLHCETLPSGDATDGNINYKATREKILEDIESTYLEIPAYSPIKMESVDC